MRHRWSAQKKETDKINKPIEMRRKYHISFDIDSIEDFQQQFLEASQVRKASDVIDPNWAGETDLKLEDRDVNASVRKDLTLRGS